MSTIRAIIKLFSFLIVTIIFYLLIMLCLIGSVIGVNYEKLRGYLLRSWGKVCCKIIGIKLQVNNEPPDPPFLIVSNHLSYIDVFVLFSQLRCLFVAKSDVKSWPLMGFLIRTSGILFIDRSRKRDVTRVNDLISKNINQNQGVILFPEGTTSPGIDVLPFRTSLLQYPAERNFPVSYVAISYGTSSEDLLAYQSVCWWDDTPFFFHFFELLKMKEIHAKVNFGKERIAENDRKVLAEKLQQAVEEEFIPVFPKSNFKERHGEFRSVFAINN